MLLLCDGAPDLGLRLALECQRLFADPVLDLANVVARLTINGREIGHGTGGDVMGNPLNALTWLADKLAAAGTPLKHGMIVMTGSMVPIQFPAAGDHAIVEVEELGTAELVAT